MLCAYDAGSGFALVDWTKMPRDKMTDDPRTLVIRSIRELSCIIQDSEL
jgi:pyrophosphatase PpaX